MRLTPDEITAISSCAKRFFGERALVRVFGSRTDDRAAGGDIDLHIEAQSVNLATLRNELEFTAAVKAMIGDQRIDVILRPPSFDPKPIDRIARETGVQLP